MNLRSFAVRLATPLRVLALALPLPALSAGAPAPLPADSPMTTSGGHAFMAPVGWTPVAQGRRRKLLEVMDGVGLAVGKDGDKRVLTLRDGQHVYVMTEQ